MKDKLQVKNIFAAVFEKSSLDELLKLFVQKPSKQKVGPQVKETNRKRSDLSYSSPNFWGTEGTIKYIKSKGFPGKSVVYGFEYDGRVKSLDRANFVRILADVSKKTHSVQLKKEKLVPFDLVIVDLYAPNVKTFPESMDIGGQALIRAAIKNYKNVALAFDRKSIRELASHIRLNGGSTTLKFRSALAKKALIFISKRAKLEASSKF